MLTEQEFQRAVDAHLDMVYRIALNWSRVPADAEDAAQEVLLRLWRSAPEGLDQEHLRYWLTRVTLNVCKDLSRSPWRRRTVPLDAAAPTPVFQDEAKRELYEAVMALPAKYRLPLYLYYYEGYAVAEVGELLGLNPSTVQTRLARGREKLKTMLTEE